MPLVSVVTPSYNHAKFLPDRIESIHSQTLKDFEWIIIDDCSTDNSRQILQEAAICDPRIKLFLNDENLGMAGTTRLAIERSSGKYIHRAESDDACDPRFLQRMVEVLEANSEAGFAYCRSLQMDEQGNLWGGLRQEKSDRVWSGNDLFASLVMGNFISGGAILFSRAAHDAVGGFGIEPFRTACDWHFSLRMCLQYDVAYVSEPLACHRTHAENLDVQAGKSFDLKPVFNETYGVLFDVFQRMILENNDLRNLQPSAIRHVTLESMTRLYVKAMLRGKRDIARQILEGVYYYDPSAPTGWAWVCGCFSALIKQEMYDLFSGLVSKGITKRRSWEYDRTC